MSLKATVLAIGLIVVPPIAMASPSLTEDHKIFHRSYFSVEANLAEQGIIATSIEEWGDVVRVETRDETNAVRIILVDKDTLRPLPKRT
jgi:hypothetical protein